MVWSNEQVEQWQLRYQEYLKDAASVAYFRDIDQQREHVRQEMLQWLNAFLDGNVTLKEFNTLFQKKTHNEWSAFSLRGMSGGLFLNKLVKHVLNEELPLTHQLRSALRVPLDTVAPTTKDLWNGREHMQKFTQFLEELITFQHVPRFHLQPARVPFFLSAWWHMQAIEQWPIFYMSVRRVLLIEEQVDKSSQDPIEAYFEFRQGFIALVQALDISVWELEHLCTWHGQQNSNVSNPGNTNRIACDNLSIQAGSSQIALPPESSQARANHGQHPLVKRESMSLQKGCQDLSRHTYLQWLLAKLGHKVGCRVWIRAADHGKEWNNERLGMLSLPCFPAITDSAFMQIIERIDVLWLLKDEVVAAYEIEQAHTDVSAGLLRLYDLNALFPERDLYLCIVIPQDRLEKVQFELSRPVFQRHGTQQHYELISEELLVQHSEHILRWASSPSVIKSLVSFLAPENEHLPNLCS